MKQKTKIALYLFLFLFPIIHIVVFLLYYVLVFVDGYKQEQIITSKIQCVTKYSKYIDGKIRNVYVMENVLSQRFLDDYPPFFLSDKSIFLEYNADSKQSDTTVTLSFNKDDKELTVTHNINSADILIQKDKMHGIKIKYITNSSESEDD